MMQEAHYFLVCHVKKAIIQVRVSVIQIGVPTKRRLERGQFLLCIENDVLPARFHFLFHDNRQIEVHIYILGTAAAATTCYHFSLLLYSPLYFVRSILVIVYPIDSHQ